MNDNNEVIVPLLEVRSMDVMAALRYGGFIPVELSDRCRFRAAFRGGGE